MNNYRRHPCEQLKLVMVLTLATTTSGYEESGLGPVLENVAANKPTIQGPTTFKSSTRLHESFLAVDGLLSSYATDCASVIQASIMWWIVDLKRSRNIHRVRILTRKSSNYKLENITVDMFDQDPREDAEFPQKIGEVCATQVKQITPGVLTNVDCASVLKKRFVRIVKYGSSFLVLCEVQVMAEELSPNSGQTYKVIPQTASAADVSSMTLLGLFRSGISCGTALAANLAHTGFQFETASGQCLMFDISPFTDNDGLESASSWSTYKVL